jgi:hypothetical protein
VNMAALGVTAAELPTGVPAMMTAANPDIALSAEVEQRIADLKQRCDWLMILVKSWRPTAYIGWERIQAPTVEELLGELDEILQHPSQEGSRA